MTFRRGRAIVADLLAARAPLGRVLEVAAGTGILSELLAPHAAPLVLLDSSPASLAVARRRVAASVPGAEVASVCADVFTWPAGSVDEARFDTICFSSWLHHVPRTHFARFWGTLGALLAPEGEVLFDFPDQAAHRRPIAEAPPSPSDDYALYATGDVSVRDHRQQRWHVVDVRWDPDELAAQLAALGWAMTIEGPGWFDAFHWASARRSVGDPLG